MGKEAEIGRKDQEMRDQGIKTDHLHGYLKN